LDAVIQTSKKVARVFTKSPVRFFERLRKKANNTGRALAIITRGNISLYALIKKAHDKANTAPIFSEKLDNRVTLVRIAIAKKKPAVPKVCGKKPYPPLT
jgi:hypothetical protein